VTDVRGTGERVLEVVGAARGCLERISFKPITRDTVLHVIVISCTDGEGAQGVLHSLELLDGVSILGVQSLDGTDQKQA